MRNNPTIPNKTIETNTNKPSPASMLRIMITIIITDILSGWPIIIQKLLDSQRIVYDRGHY